MPLTAVGDAMGENADQTGGVVATCSALKRSYRTLVAQRVGRPMVYVLLDGDRATLEARINARRDHFMPPSMLDSQLATLERPADDEPAITVTIEQDVDGIVAEIEAALAPMTGDG